MEIKRYLETNDNGNTAYQNLWEVPKEILRQKFAVISAYIKKKNDPSNSLTLWLKELEKE
jgi:hypothetical protein